MENWISIQMIRLLILTTIFMSANQFLLPNIFAIVSSIHNPIQVPTVLFSYFSACPIKD
jgi:hypothetical protein